MSRDATLSRPHRARSSHLGRPHARQVPGIAGTYMSEAVRKPPGTVRALPLVMQTQTPVRRTRQSSPTIPMPSCNPERPATAAELAELARTLQFLAGSRS